MAIVRMGLYLSVGVLSTVIYLILSLENTDWG